VATGTGRHGRASPQEAGEVRQNPDTGQWETTELGRQVAFEQTNEDYGVLAPFVRLLDRIRAWWLLSTRQKECDLLGNRPLIDFPVIDFPLGPLWLGHLTRRFPAIPGELTVCALRPRALPYVY
jgi:hypothetical protein